MRWKRNNLSGQESFDHSAALKKAATASWRENGGRGGIVQLVALLHTQARKGGFLFAQKQSESNASAFVYCSFSFVVLVLWSVERKSSALPAGR